MIIPSRLKALIVDDNSYARAISAQHFKKLGVGQTVEASGGAEAMLLLLSEQFDLMLTDWYMPDISGAGLLQVLRDPRFGAASGMPVILMTAYPSRDNLERARELGVNEILAKPFTVEQLGLAVGRALGATGPAQAEDAFFL
ncbi:MAG: response regulator [Devosia sp.]|nr:response regulator [Devosia sp.]